VSPSEPSTPPLSDDRLHAVLPVLQALDERLGQALLPSLTVTTPTAVAGSLWQIAKALHGMVEVLDASSGEQQASALTGVSDALEQAAGDVRQVRADLLHLQDLAAEELTQQVTDMDLGCDAIADGAYLAVALPNGTSARIQIDIDLTTGRASWSSEDVDLAPVGGRRQLDLAAGLRSLAQIVTGALPPSAFEADL
jgi:hypothetical protein